MKIRAISNANFRAFEIATQTICARALPVKLITPLRATEGGGNIF